jgi:hypothetical protein
MDGEGGNGRNYVTLAESLRSRNVRSLVSVESDAIAGHLGLPPFLPLDGAGHSFFRTTELPAVETSSRLGSSVVCDPVEYIVRTSAVSNQRVTVK